MHVVMRNIGERIVTSTNIVVTVLAVRDGAVLFGIEPILVVQPREEEAAIPALEASAALLSSG